MLKYLEYKPDREEAYLNILILQGPNLNLLGKREPGVYGSESMEDIHSRLKRLGEMLHIELRFYQSNHEGDLVDAIQNAWKEGVQGIVLNAGAYTHTSVAIRDALAGTALPFVEIHISNVHKREEFRHHSYISELASGIVVGFGSSGYDLALLGLAEKLRRA